MKKVLMISFLIFTILISFLHTSYAAVTVTGEKIYNFYKKLTEYSLTIKQVSENGNSTFSFDFSEFIITHKDNKIIFTAPNNTVALELNYTIDNNKISFSTLKTIDTDKLENFDDGMSELTSILLINSAITSAFLSVADIQGTDLELAYSYFSAKFEGMSEKDDIQITDDLFNYSQKITDTSIEINLEINLDNWSKVNSIDSKSYTIIFTQIDNNEKNSSINNSSTGLQGSVNNVTNSLNKLPQTGNFFNLQDALFLLILACFAGIVVLIVPNTKYRNINKK